MCSSDLLINKFSLVLLSFEEGYNIKRIINYRTSHNEKFDENFMEVLKSNMPDIVYIYSKNSASSFLKFIKIRLEIH